MQAYSQDLRERVLRALARGDRPTDIARRFEVSRVWVYQVRDRERETGVRSSFQIGPIAGHGWRRRSKCFAAGSQPSPVCPWPTCGNGWRNRAFRSKLALCGTS
jgi:hypothetical protein